MATYHDLQKYYENLKESYSNSEESYYFNNDRSHNAMVMKFILDHSSNIYMYCGELSVFRDPFYNYIQEEKDIIKENVIRSFETFLNKEKSNLSIIVENFSNSIWDDLICKDLFTRKIKEGRIQLYKLDNNFSFKKDINHFCYSDSGIVRFEVDKNQHNAICVFHHKTYLDNMKKSFGILCNIAKDVNKN